MNVNWPERIVIDPAIHHGEPCIKGTRATETLLGMRRKWERGQSVSRAEWQVFGYYLQQGCESSTEGPRLSSIESYVVLLEAFVAALALLRPGKNRELDYEYLWNLVAEPLRPEMEVTVEAVIKAARQNLRRLREPGAADTWLPVFIGRNLRFLFSDGRLKGIEALNQTLRPYLTVLFRVAARGHYLHEGGRCVSSMSSAITPRRARRCRGRWWSETARSRFRWRIITSSRCCSTSSRSGCSIRWSPIRWFASSLRC